MARNSILNSKAKKLKLLEIMVINSWIVRKSWIFQKSSNSYKNGRFFVKNYFHYIHKNSNSGRHYSRKIRQFRSKTRLFYSKNNTFFTQIYQICFHEMFRSKFWLNMTIFEKTPHKMTILIWNWSFLTCWYSWYGTRSDKKKERFGMIQG